MTTPQPALTFHHNPVAGTPFTGKNVGTLDESADFHGYRSRAWAGFRQWIKMGRVVAKGQKATKIIMVVAAKEKGANGSDTKVRRIKSISVFNFEQTVVLEPKPAPADTLAADLAASLA